MTAGARKLSRSELWETLWEKPPLTGHRLSEGPTGDAGPICFHAPLSKGIRGSVEESREMIRDGGSGTRVLGLCRGFLGAIDGGTAWFTPAVERVGWESYLARTIKG